MFACPQLWRSKFFSKLNFQLFQSYSLFHAPSNSTSVLIDCDTIKTQLKPVFHSILHIFLELIDYISNSSPILQLDLACLQGTRRRQGRRLYSCSRGISYLFSSYFLPSIILCCHFDLTRTDHVFIFIK